MIIHNDTLRPLIQTRYTRETLAPIVDLLEAQDTLKFYPLSTGLFSAAETNPLSERTGYKRTWVRDNVHVAHALWVGGNPAGAARTISALAKFLAGQHRRFVKIIEEPGLASVPYNRPHVRFDGEALAELTEKWSHDQNDALGYFLWLYSRLAAEGKLTPGAGDLETLALFPRYFQAIEYWQSADSGHWEEPPRRVSASSIGAVVAGLKQMKHWLEERPEAAQEYRSRVAEDLIPELISRGTDALNCLLPWESRGSYNRRDDAALLFLIYPLNVVSGSQARQIIENVTRHLQGEIGIKRYLGDSFYCANYESNLRGHELTKDFTDDITLRDSFFVAGQEAQWCLFDPIVSIYYGLRFRESRVDSDLIEQTKYLNRSLGQITGASGRNGSFLCPELYYLEHGKYQTSRSTPLLWTQANLSIALSFMEHNL